MSEDQKNSISTFERIPKTPFLNRVTYPIIEIKDRTIRLVLEDAEGHEIELNFQPYQASKLTTYDCYLKPEGSAYVHDQIFYQKNSAWIEALKSTLKIIDRSATFLDQAVHFIIPAGDDVLEIVAWKVEMNYQGKTMVFPEG